MSQAISNFDVNTTDNVRLTFLGEVQSNDIYLNFHTLNNNDPKSNGDLIAFYEADDSGTVYPDTKAIMVTPVDKTQSDTDILIKSVPRKQRNYAFAYVQGTSIDNFTSVPFSQVKISSLLTLPKNAVGGSAYNISLNIRSTGDVVLFSYTGIPNTEPKDVAWVGIWKSNNWNIANAPDFFYQITESGATNSLEINDLLVNTNYYLGYFLDGYNAQKTSLKKNHLAAYTKFKTIF